MSVHQYITEYLNAALPSGVDGRTQLKLFMSELEQLNPDMKMSNVPEHTPDKTDVGIRYTLFQPKEVRILSLRIFERKLDRFDVFYSRTGLRVSGKVPEHLPSELAMFISSKQRHMHQAAT